jgi:hypothetical protein
MTGDDGNGGFPEPPPGEPVNVVSCVHAACGAETHVRLPGRLPARAVRRVVCVGCGEAYELPPAEEIPASAPPPPAERRPHTAWRIASIPIAAAAVVGALLLIRGLEDDGGTDERDLSSPAAPVVSGTPRGESGQEPTGSPEVVRGPTYTLALPPGWERTDPPPGATLAARSEDRTGEVALWIEDDPGLSFGEFEARSVKQLGQLAGSAEVANRVTGPTAEDTVVRLTSDRSPAGTSPVYEVTLRASGPNRYYLSTTLAPGASRVASEGVDLIHSSFVPAPQ